MKKINNILVYKKAIDFLIYTFNKALNTIIHYFLGIVRITLKTEDKLNI